MPYILDIVRRFAFRWLAVCAGGDGAHHLAAVAGRSVPPLLPVADLPQFDIGWLLLVSLAIVLVRPGIGLALHASVLLVAILLDETRLQPEFLSSCFLILATLSAPAARLIGRLPGCVSGLLGVPQDPEPRLLRDDGHLSPAEVPERIAARGPGLLDRRGPIEMSLGILAVVPRRGGSRPSSRCRFTC